MYAESFLFKHNAVNEHRYMKSFFFSINELWQTRNTWIMILSDEIQKTGKCPRSRFLTIIRFFYSFGDLTLTFFLNCI